MIVPFKLYLSIFIGSITLYAWNSYRNDHINTSISNLAPSISSRLLYTNVDIETPPPKNSSVGVGVLLGSSSRRTNYYKLRHTEETKEENTDHNNEKKYFIASLAGAVESTSETNNISDTLSLMHHDYPSTDHHHRTLAETSLVSSVVSCDSTRPVVKAFAKDFPDWRKGIALILLILSVVIFLGGLIFFCLRSSSIYLETRGITLILPIAVTGWSVLSLPIREAFGDNIFPCILLYIGSYVSGMALTAGLGARLLSLFSAQLAQLRVQELMQTKERVFLSQKKAKGLEPSLSPAGILTTEPYDANIYDSSTVTGGGVGGGGAPRVIVARHSQSMRKPSHNSPERINAGVTENQSVQSTIPSSNNDNLIVNDLLPRRELGTMKELEEPMYTSGTESKSPPTSRTSNHTTPTSPLRMEALRRSIQPNFNVNTVNNNVTEENDTITRLHETNLINQLSISIPVARDFRILHNPNSSPLSSNSKDHQQQQQQLHHYEQQQTTTVSTTEDNPTNLAINKPSSRVHTVGSPGLSPFASPVPNLSETTLLRMMNPEGYSTYPSSSTKNNETKQIAVTSINGTQDISKNVPFNAEGETSSSSSSSSSVATTIMPLSSSLDNLTFAKYRWVRFIEYFRFHHPSGQLLAFGFLSIPWVLAIIINICIDSYFIYGNYDNLPNEFSHVQVDVPWTGRCGCYLGRKDILFFGCWGFVSIFIYTLMYRYSLSLFTENYEDVYHIRKELLRLFIIEAICGAVYFFGKINNDWNIDTFSSDYAMLVAVILQQILMLWIPANTAGKERWILATKTKLRGIKARSGRKLLFNGSKHNVHHVDDDEDDDDDIDTVTDSNSTTGHSPIAASNDANTSTPLTIPYRPDGNAEGSSTPKSLISSPKELDNSHSNIPWTVRWFSPFFRPHQPPNVKKSFPSTDISPRPNNGSTQEYGSSSLNYPSASMEAFLGKSMSSLRRMLIISPTSVATPTGSSKGNRNSSPLMNDGVFSSPLSIASTYSSSSPPSSSMYHTGEQTDLLMKLDEPNNEPPVSTGVRYFDIRQIASRPVNSVLTGMEIQSLTYSLVYTRIGRSYFKELLAQEFAMENLLFLMDALSFRQLLWTRNYRHRTTTNRDDRHHNRSNAHNIPLSRTSSNGESPPPNHHSYISDMTGGHSSHITDTTNNSSQQKSQRGGIISGGINDSRGDPVKVSSPVGKNLPSDSTSPNHTIGVNTKSSGNRSGDIHTPSADLPSPASLPPSTYLSNASSFNREGNNNGGTTPVKMVAVFSASNAHDPPNSRNGRTISNEIDYTIVKQQLITNDEVRMGEVFSITRSQTSPDTGANNNNNYNANNTHSHPFSLSANNSDSLPLGTAQPLQATIVTASVHGSIDNYAKSVRLPGELNVPIGQDIQLTKYVHTTDNSSSLVQKDSLIYRLRKDVTTSLSFSSTIPPTNVPGGGGGIPYHTSDHTGIGGDATQSTSENSQENISRMFPNNRSHNSSSPHHQHHHHSSTHRHTRHFYDPRHVVMEEDLIECAVTLAQRYIDEAGEFPVNIAAATARRILRRIKKGIITIDLFWEAEIEVFTLLARGPIVRFTTKPKLWNKWSQEYLLQAIRRENQRQSASAKNTKNDKAPVSFQDKMKNSLSMSRGKGSFRVFGFGSGTDPITTGINKSGTLNSTNSNVNVSGKNNRLNINGTVQIIPEENIPVTQNNAPSNHPTENNNNNNASYKSMTESIPLSTSDHNPPINPASSSAFGFFRRKSGTYPSDNHNNPPYSSVTHSQHSNSTAHNTTVSNQNSSHNNPRSPITGGKHDSTVSSTENSTNTPNSKRRTSQEPNNHSKRRTSQESPSNPSVHETGTVVTNNAEPRRTSIVQTFNTPLSISSPEDNVVSQRRLSLLSSSLNNTNGNHVGSSPKEGNDVSNVLPLAVFPDDTPENSTDSITLPGFIASAQKH